MFFAVDVDVGALFVGHVTIRQALEFGANEVRCYRFGCEKKL